MRYGIFSDIHSNQEALTAVVKAYAGEKIGQYICVGDIVGYATNPNECISMVRDLEAESIAGNHDQASVGIFPVGYFNSDARQAIAWTQRELTPDSARYLSSLLLTGRNRDFTFVHGSLYEPEKFRYMADNATAAASLAVQDTQICFVGHTHRAGVFISHNDELTYRGLREDEEALCLEEGCRYIIDVGSVGQPRDGNHRCCYCVFDSDKRELVIKRIPYDTDSARRKIIGQGLARRLGDRLLSGS